MTLSPTDLKLLAAHVSTHGSADGFVPKHPKKVRKNKEWRLQYEAFAWWRSEPRPIPHHLFFHIPNGSVLAGNKEQRALKGRMLKLTGMENGVADCFLSAWRGPWHGAYLEFKAAKGVLSPEQSEFLADVQAQGYFTAVVRSLDEAKLVILNYLNEPTR